MSTKLKGPSNHLSGVSCSSILTAYEKCLIRLAGEQEQYSNKTKARVIQELKEHYDVMSLVEVAEIPRSTYYYWEKRLDRPDKYADVKAQILLVAHTYEGRYAYRRVTEHLKELGFEHDPKTILRLMSEMGLEASSD
ncbi:IS3 family transposase [Rossellomorea marisflavi]|uniref:IS3 family transposase n=1 Tax=Rossellomorea marisflavi TaxID=189381 RepID=UPI003457781C